MQVSTKSRATSFASVRMIDEAFMIHETEDNIKVNEKFHQLQAKELKLTCNKMEKSSMKFLDLLI